DDLGGGSERSQWYGFPTLDPARWPFAARAVRPRTEPTLRASGITLTMGRTAGGPGPNWSFPFPNPRVTIPPVQEIAASRSVRPPISAVVVGVLVGVALLAGGLFLAWLAFATPMVNALAPAALRPSPAQMAVGGLAWGI